MLRKNPSFPEKPGRGLVSIGREPPDTRDRPERSHDHERPRPQPGNISDRNRSLWWLIALLIYGSIDAYVDADFQNGGMENEVIKQLNKENPGILQNYLMPLFDEMDQISLLSKRCEMDKHHR